MSLGRAGRPVSVTGRRAEGSRQARLRPMEAADAARLGRMHHQAWVDTYGDALPPDYFEHWTAGKSVARWVRILAESPPPGVIRVTALDRLEVVGFATSGPTRALTARPVRAADLELWGLYVARDHLGTGLGQQLLDAVLGPATPAEVWVFRGNTRARAFHSRNGFRADGAEWVDARFPQLPEVRMVR